MKKVLKFLDENLEAAILVFLLGVISVVMFLQIIMRIAGNALPWPEELCRICFVYSGFICFAYCQKKRNAIKIDVIVNMLPKKAQAFINALGEVLLFVFYAFIFYHSVILLQTTAANNGKTSAMEIPLQFVYFGLTLGVGLACFRSIQQLFQYVTKKKGGKTE